MKSNYRRIGDFIERNNVKNKENLYSRLLGINIDKYFMPSVANVVGTDLSKYKIVKPGQFSCNRMHVGRDYRLPIAISKETEPFIVSPAYDVFEITKPDELLGDYLMMWFSRAEFDRNTWFYTDTDVRGKLGWDSFCDMTLPIPSIEEQRAIVAEYQIVTDRIQLNEQINAKLEETAQALYRHWFVDNQKSNWDTYRLGDIIEIKGGFSYKGEDIGKGETFILGMGCISFSQRFLEKGMRRYSDNCPEKHLISSGEIIIATRQQSENFPILGFPAIIPNDLINERLLVASNLYRVKNNSKFSPEFIFQTLRSKAYQDHIKLNAKGTTVGMITKDAIENFEFKLPPHNEVIAIESQLNDIAKEIERNTSTTKRMLKLKSLLLSNMAQGRSTSKIAVV